MRSTARGITLCWVQHDILHSQRSRRRRNHIQLLAKLRLGDSWHLGAMYYYNTVQHATSNRTICHPQHIMQSSTNLYLAYRLSPELLHPQSPSGCWWPTVATVPETVRAHQATNLTTHCTSLYATLCSYLVSSQISKKAAVLEPVKLHD